MKIIYALILTVLLGIAIGVATAWLRQIWTPWDGIPPVSGIESPPASSSQPEQPSPKLVIDKSDFDFGTMDIEENVRHIFRVQNAGNGPLKITKSDTSSSSISSHLEQSEIPPGESTKIIVNWKSAEDLGKFRETATFFTNDPSQPQLNLTISGQITTKLRVVPPQLAFDKISADAPATRESRLLCYQDKPWQLLEHQWGETEIAQYFQADLQSLTAEQLKEEPDARSGYLVKVTVKPGLPYGAFQQKIRLKTNLDFRSEITIPIQGSVASDITIAGPGWNADSGCIFLGIVNGQKGIQRRLTLMVRGSNRKEVKFKPIEDPALPIKLSLGETTEIDNGLVVQTPLIIEIPQGSRSINHLGGTPSDWGKITIETTHPRMPEVHIFVRFAIEE